MPCRKEKRLCQRLRTKKERERERESSILSGLCWCHYCESCCSRTPLPRHNPLKPLSLQKRRLGPRGPGPCERSQRIESCTFMPHDGWGTKDRLSSWTHGGTSVFLESARSRSEGLFISSWSLFGFARRKPGGSPTSFYGVSAGIYRPASS